MTLDTFFIQPSTDVEENLRNLEDSIQVCKSCPLTSTPINEPKKRVTFYGNPHNRIMFVAQNPGISKSKYKKPKVFAVWENPNDRLFIKNLGLVGIKRDDIYVTNMVKCSTVSNNAPEESQTVACRRHLSLEIAFLKPQVIVAVGGIARKYFKGEMGGWTKWNGIDVFGIWHPSYILRAGIGSSADEEHKKMLENQWRNTQLAVVVQHPAFKKIKVEPFIIQDVEVD